MIRQRFFKKIFTVVFIVIFFATPFAQTYAVSDIEDLSQAVREKREERQRLEKEAERLRVQILQRQKDAQSLQNQLGILDDRIAVIATDIQAKTVEIEERTLTIAEVKQKIAIQEEAIAQTKKRIAAFLLTLHQYDNRGTLALFFAYPSFSAFYERAKFIEELQSSLQRSLRSFEELKQSLASKKLLIEGERNALVAIKQTLEEKRQDISEEQATKQYLLEETKSSERKFHDLFEQAKREQEAAQADLQNLEKELRSKFAGSLPPGAQGQGKILWPIDPSRGITAYFHDPSYPFRNIFEHPAIDIRASQGTPIHVADGGYVGRARDAGLGYSYIMVIHDNGLSTVYGHVSRIDVREGEIVAQGQVIGATGGLPGTPGAGRLTTGAHLHFEVRLNGIPVNPLEYLP